MSKKYETLESALDDMTLLQEQIKKMKERGLPTSWMCKVADTSDPYCFFEKNGKLGNKSDCPYYKGHYNAGSSAATECTAVDFLLPGVIMDVYCRLHHEECPIRKRAEDAERENRV